MMNSRKELVRYTDTCKSALKCGEVLDHEWKSKVEYRPKWRQLICQTCENYNRQKNQYSISGYEKRKEKRRKKTAPLESSS